MLCEGGGYSTRQPPPRKAGQTEGVAGVFSKARLELGSVVLASPPSAIETGFVGVWAPCILHPHSLLAAANPKVAWDTDMVQDLSSARPRITTYSVDCSDLHPSPKPSSHSQEVPFEPYTR